MRRTLFAILSLTILSAPAFAARDVPAHTAADMKVFGRNAARTIAILRSTPGGRPHADRLTAALRTAMATPGSVTMNRSGFDMTRGTAKHAVAVDVGSTIGIDKGIFLLSIRTASPTQGKGGIGYRSSPGTTFTVEVDRRLGNLTVLEGKTTPIPE